MSKVKLAFYKAQTQSITDMLISCWTWIWNIGTKPYSHVEIGFEIDGKWQYFSSSIRDNGTRWKDADKLLKNPERWDIYESDYNERAITRMIERANSILNKRYDKLGILGFITITGQVLNNKDRWYCSESCWYVLTANWMKRISPRRMSKRIDHIFKPEKKEKTK